jgi:hypothetical protein
MMLRIVTAALLVIWLVLLLMGKGGFIHLLLLCALGTGFVELMAVIRSHMTVSEPDEP